MNIVRIVYWLKLVPETERQSCVFARVCSKTVDLVNEVLSVCCMQWCSGKDKSVAWLYTTRTASHCWTSLITTTCRNQTFIGIIRLRNCECLQTTAVDLFGLTLVKMVNRQVNFCICHFYCVFLCDNVT